MNLEIFILMILFSIFLGVVFAKVGYFECQLSLFIHLVLIPGINVIFLLVFISLSECPIHQKILELRTQRGGKLNKGNLDPME